MTRAARGAFVVVVLVSALATSARVGAGVRAAPTGLQTCFTAGRDGTGGAIHLVDATKDLGLGVLKGERGHATAVGDVDGDGWLDLFAGAFADRKNDRANGPQPRDVLLLGGSKGFQPDASFPVMHARTSGAAFVDLDGDGDLDLVLSRNYDESDGGRDPSRVMRNDGGKFVESTVLTERAPGRSVGVLDYDGDGKPDLLLVEDRFGHGSTKLFHNDGDLHFTDATKAAGLPQGIQGLGVAAADLNGDGKPDLLIGGSNQLFVNKGGTFEEVKTDVFTWKLFGKEDDPAGVAVGDVNRDGRMDVVIGQHFGSASPSRPVPIHLYLNEGNDDAGRPRFRDVTDAAGLVGLPTKAPHVEIVDLDADGWPDILTTASAANGTEPAVFRHTGLGSGGVPKFDAPGGLGNAQYWIAGATFDADRDGRLDVFLTEWEPSIGSRIFRNDSRSGHWLGVEVGRGGSRGIGTRVEVFASGGANDPKSRLGVDEITASTGYSSGAPSFATFGLGKTDRVDLVVHRPGRAAQVFRSVAVDRMLGTAGGCR